MSFRRFGAVAPRRDPSPVVSLQLASVPGARAGTLDTRRRDQSSRGPGARRNWKGSLSRPATTYQH
jgi:hypothetical protein